jgi:two-component system sensor histidine kinase QseC
MSAGRSDTASRRDRGRGSDVRKVSVEQLQASIAEVAHELNNLFQTSMSVLEMRGGDDSRDLSMVLSSLNRGHVLVRQLWLLAGRGDRAMLEPRIRHGGGLIRECCALCEPSLAPGVTIEIVGAERALPWPLSAAELQQVLLNLLLNAAKVTPPEGQILVQASQEGGGLTLSVHDTGPGFDTTKARLEKGDGRHGSGLGLSIVRSIAERHGGELIIEGWPGEGSCVALRFPGSR